MIMLENKTLNGQPIKVFEVWWRTIRGLHTTLDEALEQATLTEMPADLIRAVPVVIDIHGHYEEIVR